MSVIVKGGFEMRKKIFAAVSAVFTVVILVAIWRFSAQGAIESSELSGRLARFLSDLPVLGGLLGSGTLEHVLRKLAHCTIFALLGMSLVGATLGACPTKKAILITLLFGILYAALDELHQSFVPGRAPSVYDVLIDTGGVILGLLVGVLIYQKIVAPKNPD